ncbi:unnamed protein product [Ambrosiozyma monospora]|uniref:Unnamed protein product n=1 Tax=Ambrosiozyma monospora TaxID=43982 RepID=A0A9W6YT86_AMBMO|nr:unnamed protein product [Ambrosiozyma monospora]
MVKTDIDYESVPGTSLLVDVNHNLTPEEAAETEQGIVLIPTPSDDPNDPLNWSKPRKLMAVFCLIVYVFAGSIPGCCIYSILTDIAADESVHMTVGKLNAGTGYMFLFLGLGNLILLPLAEQYGKRPVYLVSILADLMFNLWQPYTKSNGEWIASRILTGFFYAPIESLPEITITDLFFEHERATYMGIYGAALFSSNYAAPMLAGFVNDSLGWKWTIWIAVIFGSVCFLFMCVFMEETNYTRRIRVKRGLDGDVLTAYTSHGQEIKDPNLVTVKSNLDSADEKGLKGVTSNTHIGNQAALIEEDEIVEYPPVRTFIQRMSLTHGIKKEQHLWDYFKAAFLMAQFPVVLYGGFLYGSSLFWYSVLNATEAMVLGAEPYNFKPSMCGLAYLSPVIFTFIIYPYAGWSTDWIKIKIAKKHHGHSQAEDRLWVLIVYMILGPFALILWGVGAAKGVHWFGVVFGLGLLAGLCVVGCVSSVTYILDTYHEMGSGALVCAIIIRNSMNFGMDYAITPFVTNVGLQNCFVASAFICFFCIGTFFIMILTGKHWRTKMGKKYWKIVEEYRSKGLIS